MVQEGYAAGESLAGGVYIARIEWCAREMDEWACTGGALVLQGSHEEVRHENQCLQPAETQRRRW